MSFEFFIVLFVYLVDVEPPLTGVAGLPRVLVAGAEVAGAGEGGGPPAKTSAASNNTATTHKLLTFDDSFMFTRASNNANEAPAMPAVFYE
jgi:hypothetical protein